MPPRMEAGNQTDDDNASENSEVSLIMDSDEEIDKEDISHTSNK